jgi:hypothetical protein
MDLFRSEEHVRNWASFAEDSDEGMTPLPDMVTLFSGPYFKQRLDQYYVSLFIRDASYVSMSLF